MTKKERKEFIEDLKQIFVTREEFNELFAVVLQLKKTMDTILKEIITMREEMHAMNYRIHSHDSWISLAAPKIDVPYNP